MRTSRINLRAGEFTFVSERAELKRQLLSGGIMVGILLAMLLILFGLRYSDRSQRYQALSASLENMAVETFPELKSLPASSSRVQAMSVRLQEERRESDLFVPLSTDSLSVLDILREITQAVPSDVQIDVRELVMEGEKVRFEAETNSYNAAEQIKQNLLSSGVFASADIPEAKDSLDQSKVKFKMNLQLQQKIL
jgi:Tfp pilus assembly protein PilN